MGNKAVECIVELATPADLPAVSEMFVELDAQHERHLPGVYRQSDPKGRRVEFLEQRRTAPDAGVFVARAGGLLAGFVIVRTGKAPDVPVLVPRVWAYIEDVAVKPEFRRRGIGRALLRWETNAGFGDSGRHSLALAAQVNLWYLSSDGRAGP